VIVGHLHLESVAAAKVDHAPKEDRVLAGWQRIQQDRVTVGDSELLRARYTRIERLRGRDRL